MQHVCEEPACQCRRRRLVPWVGKMPSRREWLPSPVLLPGESPRTEEPGGPQPVGSQRVSNLATKQQRVYTHTHTYMIPL